MLLPKTSVRGGGEGVGRHGGGTVGSGGLVVVLVFVVLVFSVNYFIY